MAKCSSCGAEIADGATFCTNCGAPANQQTNQNYNYQQPAGGYQPQPQTFQQKPHVQRSAYIAAILAVIFSPFGIYNFYLGYKDKAIAQLLIGILGSALFGVGAVAVMVWSIVEMIKILTGEIDVDGENYPIKMGF